MKPGGLCRRRRRSAAAPSSAANTCTELSPVPRPSRSAAVAPPSFNARWEPLAMHRNASHFLGRTLPPPRSRWLWSAMPLRRPQAAHRESRSRTAASGRSCLSPGRTRLAPSLRAVAGQTRDALGSARRPARPPGPLSRGGSPLRSPRRGDQRHPWHRTRPCRLTRPVCGACGLPQPKGLRHHSPHRRTPARATTSRAPRGCRALHRSPATRAPPRRGVLSDPRGCARLPR
jgi:hypothetical protein